MEDVAWCSCCGAALDICVLIEHGAGCKAKRQAEAIESLKASLPASVPLMNAGTPWSLDQMVRMGSDCTPDEAWGPKDRSAASWSARDASEILPGLYLGNIVAARDAGFLREKGIKGIVNCANEASPLSAADLAAAGVRKLVHLPLHDDCEPATVARSMSLILRGAHAAAALTVFGGDADATAASLIAAGAPLALAGAAGVPVTHEQAAAAAAVSHMSSDLLGPAASDGAVADSSIHAAPLPHPIFIHCAVGRSRSASVVAAFLVLFRGLRLLDAMMLLRHRRPIAMPNLGFFAALVAIEELANARKAAAAVGEAATAPSSDAAPAALAGAAGGAGGAASAPAPAAAPVAASGSDAVPCAIAPPGCSIDGRLLALHPNGSFFERFQAYTGRRMPADPWVEVLAAARKHATVEGASMPAEEVVAMIRDGVAAPHASATSRGR